MDMHALHIDQDEFHQLADVVLQEGKGLCFTPRGNSMAPFIISGDEVYIKRSKSYRKGDVVLLRNNRVLMIHRIVDKTEGGVITRGDASSSDDPGPVDRAEILGKVYRVSGNGYNYHLHPPISRLLVMPFFSRYLFRNRIVRTVGKIMSPLLG